MKCCIVQYYIWLFSVCKSAHLGVSSIQRVKVLVTLCENSDPKVCELESITLLKCAVYIYSADMNGNWFVAQAYASGHFITYDGSMYEFNGIGEYLLTKITTSAHGEDIYINIVQVLNLS